MYGHPGGSKEWRRHTEPAAADGDRHTRDSTQLHQLHHTVRWETCRDSNRQRYKFIQRVTVFPLLHTVSTHTGTGTHIYIHFMLLISVTHICLYLHHRRLQTYFCKRLWSFLPFQCAHLAVSVCVSSCDYNCWSSGFARDQRTAGQQNNSVPPPFLLLLPPGCFSFPFLCILLFIPRSSFFVSPTSTSWPDLWSLSFLLSYFSYFPSLTHTFTVCICVFI